MATVELIEKVCLELTGREARKLLALLKTSRNYRRFLKNDMSVPGWAERLEGAATIGWALRDAGVTPEPGYGFKITSARVWV